VRKNNKAIRRSVALFVVLRLWEDTRPRQGKSQKEKGKKQVFTAKANENREDKIISSQ